MKRRNPTFATLALAGLLAISGNGYANDDGSQTTEATVEEEAKDPNERICKRVQVTGTHFKKRVCFKRSKWEQMERESQEAMRELRDRSG